MAEIGEPIRRHHVIPNEQPIQAPAEPQRPGIPVNEPGTPSKTPAYEPAK